MENITEGEIKFLKFDTVKRVLNKINDMDRNEENPDVIEIAILNLALKFLTSSFLEKRIKGMNEINERVSDD